MKLMNTVNKAYDRREKMYNSALRKRTQNLRKLKKNDLVLIPAGRIRKQDYFDNSTRLRPTRNRILKEISYSKSRVCSKTTTSTKTFTCTM